MTYNDFIWKYNGKYIDYDGMFSTQCVDLMRAYVREVFGWQPYTAIPPRGNAIDIFKNFKDNQYFKKVLNGPLNCPKRGDIVFYKAYPFLYGTVGHVEIVDQADSYFMVNFSQNWPTGTPCHFVKRGTSKLFNGYRGCVGWLTPKK